MGEFHEHCPVISKQIRAIRPFVTFVFQKRPVLELYYFVGRLSSATLIYVLFTLGY
jgi:hypothetical protein